MRFNIIKNNMKKGKSAKSLDRQWRVMITLLITLCVIAINSPIIIACYMSENYMSQHE